MSETVTHIGKLKEVDLQGKSTEQWAEDFFKANGTTELDSYYDDWLEKLQSDDDKFIVVNDKIYESIEDKKSEYEDICYLRDNGDGTFDYVMQFYNGGTCLPEMIEDGFEKLKK